jgi:arabinose-5-phosphate isomerase
MHPAEASHGDLGMITGQDVVIALSHSGESDELLAIVPQIKRTGARLISMTGNPASGLALESDVHLDASVSQEACPLGLAPTASTTAALALGDALAVALLDVRGFSAEDFARAHPGFPWSRKACRFRWRCSKCPVKAWA